MKKLIYYRSPCLNKVATVKATINSALSLSKYSKDYDVKIINVCGEWNNYKSYLQANNIGLEKLSFDYYNFLPKNGFIKSRISYLIIILISFIPLIVFLKNKKPDFFIIHLITSLPLVLINLLKSKTKIILRISGFPKLNFLRKKLWKVSRKKIFKITCPTQDLKINLINNNIFEENKIIKLFDPVINISEFIKKKNDKNKNLIVNLDKPFFIAAGRLTKQKNFIYLIGEFKKFLGIYPDEKLLIFGEGELKSKILREIKLSNTSENIKLCGYTNNIYKYMVKSKAFILSSLWEDPGFVMIESALCNTLIISSDCQNGPKEFLLNGKAGLIFKSNLKNELYNKLIEFKKSNEIDLYKKRILAKKNSNNFTMFRHYKTLRQILEND